MDLSDSVEELQKVADYRKARNRLRAFGTGSLIFGVLNTLIGVMGLSQHPLNFVLVLIGGLQLVVGLWNVAVPTAEGIIVDGIALLVVGGWNLFITLLNFGAGHGEAGQFVLYGIMQIGYGIYRFVSYPQFSRELSHKPPREDVKRLDEMVKGIQMANLKTSDDVITFQASNFFGGNKQWRGRLAGSAALFVAHHGHEVLIAPQDSVTITVTGKVFLSSTLKASFQIRDKTLSGTISPNSFARYEDWKNADDQADEVPENPSDGEFN